MRVVTTWRRQPGSREAAAIARAVNLRQELCEALRKSGLVAQAQGDHQQARRLLAEALSIAQALKSSPEVRAGLIGLVANMLGPAGAAALADDATQRTVRVLGWAQSEVQRVGAVLDRSCQEVYQRSVAVARARLGDAAFEEAWAAGQEMALDEAIGLVVDARSEE